MKESESKEQAELITEPIVFFIPVTKEFKFCVPKARPRENGRLPPRYRDWKDINCLALKTEMKAYGKQVFPLHPQNIAVCVIFCGSLRLNSDLDNAVGSWLDAMTDAGILENDSVKNLKKLYTEFEPVPKIKKKRNSEPVPDPIIGTRIIILPAEKARIIVDP